MKTLLFSALIAVGLGLIGGGETFAASRSAARAQYEKALRLGERGDVAGALRALQAASAEKGVSPDKITLTRARLLFQKGEPDLAIEEYDKIPTNSRDWVTALEEKAWAYLRLGQYDRALAQLKTTFAPIFAAQTGPEAYLLTGIIHLKTCNFSSVRRTILDFKEAYRHRIPELQRLANTGQSAAADKLLRTFMTSAKGGKGSKELSQKALGIDSLKLPRSFDQDLVLAQAVRQSDDQRALKRLQVLAQAELEELHGVLRRLHILEAEVIQRLYTFDKVKFEQASHDWDKVKSGDYLVFPAEDSGVKNDKEVWIDELNNYQFMVNACPNRTASQKVSKTEEL